MTMGPYYDHQVCRFERPDPVSEPEILLARARRARAEAMAEVFGALYAGLKTAATAVAGFVRHAGAGAAQMPPRSDLRRHRTAHLTGGCD
jgi:hypothetical protein